MKALKYTADVHLDPTAECYCRYGRKETESHPIDLHYHDYYEIFLVINGTLLHLINNEEQILSKGVLLFIRDFDQHALTSCNDMPYEILNLAFSKKTLEAMSCFLGNGFDLDFLLSAPLPPIVSLSEDETESLATKLMLLNHTSDKADLCLKARSLLVHIFSNYFYNYTKRNQYIPAWLSITCEKMKHPQNFIAGTKFMYELSGKSREHLTRCMLQYYHITPTAYVTELRLTYAANLLLISNLSITDICYESGFENLSWFYKLFVQKYSMTPKKYRENHLIKQPIN